MMMTLQGGITCILYNDFEVVRWFLGGCMSLLIVHGCQGNFCVTKISP